MKRLLLLYGMKRSGNHAFIEWIKANGNVAFFNNIVRIERVLRGESPLPEPIPFERWLDRKSRVPLLARARVMNKDVLVSFEDLEPNWQRFSTVPKRTSSILILRDPFNLFSSRIRARHSFNVMAFSPPPSPIFHRMIDLWKMHARAFLGESSQGVDVPVYFDRWFESGEYRRQIADRLGIRNSDAGLNVVTRHGYGSSFDGRQFDTRARDMNVLNRVDRLTPEEREYLAIVEEDGEVRALHERIELAAAH